MAIDEILKRTAKDLKKIESTILDSEELLQFMRQAGEDVTNQEKELRDLKTRRDRWIRALKARGIEI